MRYDRNSIVRINNHMYAAGGIGASTVTCGGPSGQGEQLRRCAQVHVSLLFLAKCGLLLLGLGGLDLEERIEFGKRLPIRVAHAVSPREVLRCHMPSSVNGRTTLNNRIRTITHTWP